MVHDTALAIVPHLARTPELVGLPVADVDALYASQVRLETKVDHVLEQLREVVQSLAARTLELRDLRDRVLILEERQNAKKESETKAVDAQRWADIEKWMVRIGAAVGALGATASAAGLI